MTRRRAHGTRYRQTVSDCSLDIEEAKTFASNQADCTQETAHLECPHDSSVVYFAANGCEISYLQGEGWMKVTEPPGEQPGTIDAPVLGTIDGKSAAIGGATGLGALWLLGMA